MAENPSVGAASGASGTDQLSRLSEVALSNREKWLTGQSDAFRAAVNGSPLEECLEILISTAIDQVEGTSQCAFYIANDEGTELRNVIGMSDEYARHVDGFAIGPQSLANAPVITPDVRDEPLWQSWLWLAEEVGYRGVWSFPVETERGRLVGTFAMYFDKPQSPTAQDMIFARSLCGTASIIIAQDQIRGAREEASQKLREYADALQKEQRRQKHLLAELQHRVRNTLAVIRSIARRTAASATSVEEFEHHLDGRLGAFARTQSYVTRDPEKGVDLELIIRDELLAHATDGGQNISIQGPKVRLSPRQAESMGLAIHELTTNAIKHGALVDDGNKIEVRWSNKGRGDRRKLHFSWRETLAGRQLEPPTRFGFGTELLERILRYELDAVPSIKFEPGGLSYQVEIPLTPAQD